jgi:hypothetical protein
MNGIINNFLIGSAMSIVPTYVLTKYYFEGDVNKKKFDYPTTIKYLAIKMGLINVCIFFALNQIGGGYDKNPVILGFLMSVILSLITKSFNDVPENVIQMKNPNLYHIYSMVVFVILYYIALKIPNMSVHI